jgi:hypothetical protein
MAMMSKDGIVGWLKDMGLNPITVPDPQGSWRYRFYMPANQDQNQLEVFGLKALPRGVAVASNTVLSPEHATNFIALDSDAKNAFMNDLVTSLNKDFVEYRIEHDNLTGDLKSFQVTAVRYDDGLTLDSFARTVSSVFKAQIAGIHCVRQHLGGNTPQGGEFAFRKLGMH